jgi:hypothetical protein
MREQGVGKVKTFSVEMQIYKHAYLSAFHIFSCKLTETPSFFTGMGEECGLRRTKIYDCILDLEILEQAQIEKLLGML